MDQVGIVDDVLARRLGEFSLLRAVRDVRLGDAGHPVGHPGGHRTRCPIGRTVVLLLGTAPLQVGPPRTVRRVRLRLPAAHRDGLTRVRVDLDAEFDMTFEAGEQGGELRFAFPEHLPYASVAEIDRRQAHGQHGGVLVGRLDDRVVGTGQHFEAAEILHLRLHALRPVRGGGNRRDQGHEVPGTDRPQRGALQALPPRERRLDRRSRAADGVDVGHRTVRRRVHFRSHFDSSPSACSTPGRPGSDSWPDPAAGSPTAALSSAISARRRAFSAST